ncbi:hypothetical protein LVJ94_07145 [Pendulispora rubella]|uniref:IPT/TIG domain-containing protein n=1 Tax=Pendulispora rubella TaxID=2741070 RepID=A0ABZ2L8C4_9BACT
MTTQAASASGLLLHLLADLSRDRTLVERFAVDAVAVLRDYKIADEKLDILRSRSAVRISAAIAAEVESLLPVVTKPPHEIVGWAAPPSIHIKSIDPNSGPLNTPVPVKVTGTGFASNAILTFANPGAKVQGTGVEVTTRPNGDTVLTAKATFTVAGVYDVVVANPGSDESPGKLPQGFTAKSQ